MLKKKIDCFIGCDASYEDAEIVMFGAPFDGTASFRAGSRFAPQAIRNDSYGLETYSPYQERDLTEQKIADCADLELCFGNPSQILDDINAQSSTILNDGKLPFMIGGEHLVTLGALRAAAKKYPELALIHFDAHTDLRNEYLGEKLSHASVIRLCHEILGDGRIFQFGIRSGEKYEFDFAAQGHTYMNKFNLNTLPEIIEKLGNRPVYFTLDLDVLDPSVFPGTGTPEPGGISFDELRRAVTLVCGKCNIVACDVNELAPHYDASGASTAVACKIIREMLLALRK